MLVRVVLGRVRVIMFSFIVVLMCCVFFFFQAEDGIRDLVRSRGLGDVYKRQKSSSSTSPSGVPATPCQSRVGWFALKSPVGE